MNYDRWFMYGLGILLGTIAMKSDPDVFWWNIALGIIMMTASLIALVVGAVRMVKRRRLIEDQLS